MGHHHPFNQTRRRPKQPEPGSDENASSRNGRPGEAPACARGASWSGKQRRVPCRVHRASPFRASPSRVTRLHAKRGEKVQRTRDRPPFMSVSARRARSTRCGRPVGAPGARTRRRTRRASPEPGRCLISRAARGVLLLLLGWNLVRFGAFPIRTRPRSAKRPRG